MGSEFKLWSRGFTASAVALLCTLFGAADVEVDGLALLAYFCLLFFYTMKQQIQHMFRHGYVPWNASKKGQPRRRWQRQGCRLRRVTLANNGRLQTEVSR